MFHPRPCTRSPWVVLPVFWVAGCASQGFHAELAQETRSLPGGHRIEVSVAEDGSVTSVEYHVRPEDIPAAARDAILTITRGGQPVDAEIEYGSAGRQYEMTVLVKGLEHEVLVAEDLRVVSMETELAPETLPVELPAAVQSIPFLEGASVTKWEGIFDGEGRLVEYHVKATKEARSYKLILSSGCRPLVLYREVEAELEVPVMRFDR